MTEFDSDPLLIPEQEQDKEENNISLNPCLMLIAAVCTGFYISAVIDPSGVGSDKHCLIVVDATQPLVYEDISEAKSLPVFSLDVTEKLL